MIDISIIIPVYNVEDYLEECLNSVINQSFENYEVICIDDKSTDNSLEILHKFAGKIHNYKIIEKEKNEGLSAARNTGMDVAEGKYILFVDSDDIIYPDACKKLYQIAEANNTDIVYFDMDRIYEDGSKRPPKKNEGIPEEVVTGRELFCIMQEHKNYKLESVRQLYKREFLKRNIIHFREGILHEDNLCSFFCIMNASRVIDAHETFYGYRQRPNSIMNSFSQRRVESLFVIICDIARFWLSNHFSQRENECISSYVHSLYETYLFYKNTLNLSKDIKIGSDEEKYLFKSLNWVRQWLDVTDDQIQTIKESSNIILYGAGRAAQNLCEILRKNGITIENVAVTDVRMNPEYVCGVPVKDIKEYLPIREFATVLVGVTEKWAGEISENLKKLGFEKIITFKNY